MKVIRKPDGSWKKIIFYNTGVTALLEYNEHMMRKIENVLEIFYSRRENIVLLWRPHPLIESTLASMRMELLNEYMNIKERYLKEKWGIYDDSSDLDRAIIISDAYYGNESSVLHLFKKMSKPIMLQNVFC